MRNFHKYMMPEIIAIDEKRQGEESQAIIDFASEIGVKIEKFRSNSVPMMLHVPRT